MRKHDFPDQAMEIGRSLGYSIIRPGDVWWFPTSRWRTDGVAWRRAGEREIILAVIRSRRPRRGYFRRLVRDIYAIGHSPAVFCPLDDFAHRLQSWGWVASVHEQGETVWRPNEPRG